MHDTQQEYDPKPYTVCVTAILYRRGKPMPKQTPLEARARLKKLKFDGISESLVDAEGKKYSGKRLRNVSVHSVSGFSDRYDILSKLEDLALEYGADAYELIDYLNEQEIQQKFGSTPYTPPATAILYRRG